MFLVNKFVLNQLFFAIYNAQTEKMYADMYYRLRIHGRLLETL